MFNKLHQLVLYESQVPYHNTERQLYAYIYTSFLHIIILYILSFMQASLHPFILYLFCIIKSMFEMLEIST